MVIDGLYERRDPAAVGGSVLVLVALWLAWQHMPVAALKKVMPEETVIKLELTELPPPPLSEPPKAEPQPEPKPQPKSELRPQPTPLPTPQPTLQPTPEPTPAPAPVQPQPVTPPPPAPAPTPAPKPVSNASLDDRYVSELRAYLNSVKRYPTSREARQSRPTGTVRVWLEVDRQGQLLDAGIEQSSESPLLDKEALRTVRTGHFPAFPAEAFAGQAKHRFVIALEYVLDGS